MEHTTIAVDLAKSVFQVSAHASTSRCCVRGRAPPMHSMGSRANVASAS